MTEYDFLSHEKLTKNLYVVRENFGSPEHTFNIYVVTGEKKVGVFDTGMGVTGVLRKYIEDNITGKNFMACYMTHGDLDHLGGSVLFDEAYMNEKELRKLDWNLNVERRFSDLSLFCGDNQGVLDFCRGTYLHNENASYKNIEDGDSIDLGGEILQVISLPGHSAGSLAFYNRQENYVLVGDGISDYNAWQRCTDFEDCIAHYERLLETLPEDAKIYNGHGTKEIPRSAVDDLVDGLRQLLAGDTGKDVSTTWMFKMVDPEELEFEMKNHANGSVVIGYNAKTL